MPTSGAVNPVIVKRESRDWLEGDEAGGSAASALGKNRLLIERKPKSATKSLNLTSSS
jgi:hypothetical protein